MDIFQKFFNSLFGFSRAHFWAHSFLPYIQPLLVQSYQNLPITSPLYADDTQSYFELDSRNFNSSINELKHCLQAVQAWQGNNKIKLKPDKTEFIVIGDDQIRSCLKLSFTVSLLGNIMEPKTLESSWVEGSTGT